MTRRRLDPPSGSPPPTTVSLGTGERLELAPLAQEICRRYRQEFPDEQELYGEAGIAWCVHDNQHLLNWAALEVAGYIDMLPEVAWLAKVLEARRFPLQRLARDLDLAVEVVTTQLGGDTGQRLAEAFAAAAAHVRSRDTFLA